jgi:hypothetical protein
MAVSGKPRLSGSSKSHRQASGVGTGEIGVSGKSKRHALTNRAALGGKKESGNGLRPRARFSDRVLIFE